MDIKERKKKFRNTQAKTDTRISVNFDLNVLNTMCAYVLSLNSNIRRGHLVNMKNLFELLDFEVYKNDPIKRERIEIIRRGVEARAIHNLKDRNLILYHIMGGLLADKKLDINDFPEVSNDELMWINATVSETLKYAFIYSKVDPMTEHLTDFRVSDYRNVSPIVENIVSVSKDIVNMSRRAQSSSTNDVTFSLRDGRYQDAMTDIYNRVTNPSSRLVTGMRGFNELLGGAFFSGKTYLILGNTGGGKSMTLIDLALQIKKYNRNFKPKDKTKTPCVLYITMENTVVESVERLFSMSTTDESMANYDLGTVMNMMKTDGGLYIGDDNPIDLVMMYIPNRTIDTSDLYTVIEDLEDDNYEVICLIQDHVKRIRSIENTIDPRFELGNIINEFRILASIKDIPVITNSHLNRDAAKRIDEGITNNKTDMLKMLGRSNIGESMLMLDNTDWACIIGKEPDSEGVDHMCMLRIKSRVRAGGSNYIAYPLTNGGIKMVEDLYMPYPVHKVTLAPNTEQMFARMGMRTENSRNIQRGPIIPNMEQYNDEDNIFRGAQYTMRDNFDIDQYNAPTEDMTSVFEFESPMMDIIRTMEESDSNPI
jgi:replicative DNA helicase